MEITPTSLLSAKQARAIAKVQKLLAKSIALRYKMDVLRLAADKAVSKLDECDRRTINHADIPDMPELTYNYNMDTVIKDGSWGDFHA